MRFDAFPDSATEHKSGGGRASRSERSLRVLIVDDHPLMREGVRLYLAGEPGIEVVGEAVDGQEAIEATHRLAPDVVLMDITMPVMDGIEATRRITQDANATGVRIVGLTMHDEPNIEREMLEAGADQFLTKGGSPTELLAAIRGERIDAEVT